MKFTPKSDSEIEQAEKERKERWVWPTLNTYDFEISGALEKEGDFGAYLHLEIKVFHPNGEWNQTITDFIGTTSPKLKALCYSVGLGERYEAGQVDDYDFNNKSGKCKLSVKKDKNGQYPDKNKISDYIRSASVAPEKAVVNEKPPFDDEIPF